MALCRLEKAPPEGDAIHRCTVWGGDFNLHSSPQLEHLCSTQTARLQVIICLSFDCYLEFNHLTVHICWSHFLPVVRPQSALILLQFNSVPQLCVTLCDSMDCSTSGFPIHRQLPELAQTHVHRVSDAIQPSRLLLSPSLPAFNLAQHQGLFQRVTSSHEVTKVLEFQLQLQYSGLISFRKNWLDLFAVQGTLKNLSNTTVQKHRFFGGQLSL